MGFFQVVNGNEMDAEKLARFWGNTLPARIENGSKVIVRRNEALIHIKNGKAADVIVNTGGYIYHSDVESDTGTKSYADIFDEFSEKHINFFGGKETVILSISDGVSSPARFGEALTELAGEKNVREAPTNAVTPPQNGKWICKCGTENEYSFCKKCGLPRTSDSDIYTEPKPAYAPAPQPETVELPPIVPSKSGEMWICGECGTKNKFSYCKNCGASRKSDSEIYTAPKTYIPLSEPKPAAPPPIVPLRSGEMWICGECGTKNKFSYCNSCGASRKSDSEIYIGSKPSHVPVPETKTATPTVPSKSEEIWICGECGTENKVRFCKKCGSARPRSVK